MSISGALLSYNGSPTVGVSVWERPSRSERVKGAVLTPPPHLPIVIGGYGMTCVWWRGERATKGVT